MDTDYNAKSRAAGFFAGVGLVVCQLAINSIDNAFSTGFDMAGEHMQKPVSETANSNSLYRAVPKLHQYPTRSLYRPDSEYCSVPMGAAVFCCNIHQRAFRLLRVPWTDHRNTDLGVLDPSPPPYQAI